MGGEVGGRGPGVMKSPDSSTITSGVVKLQRIEEGKLRAAREFRSKMTHGEKALWEKVRRRQIRGMKFRRQQIIEGFVVDFFCEKAKLVVEVDGQVHSDTNQQEWDRHRTKVFGARGVDVIRFHNDEVLDSIESVVTRIEQKVKDRIGELRGA